MLKQGGYRSAGNYFARAVEEHIRHGHDWTPALAQARKEAVRAITRGMGPPRQSAPLPLESLMGIPNELLPPEGSAFLGWPFNYRNLVVLASLWMLREIEVAFARVSDVHLSACGNCVTWLLPVSKTNPQALGKKRTLGCTCGGKPEVPCGNCLMRSHIESSNKRISSSGGTVSDSTPLFPQPSHQPHHQAGGGCCH